MIPTLVTGGAGYIGSHTAKALAQAGFEPIVLDNLSTGHRWAVKWGPLIEGDLADFPLVRKVLERYRVEAVIHLAGSACVAESMQNPRKYFRNNLANSLNLLEAMLDTGVNQIIFSSTCATYGIPEHLPIPDNHPQHPVNPYGESKLFIERIIHWFGEAHGLNWVTLRYFNAAGADPEGDLGEVHNSETHLIPRAIQASLRERPQVKIYGTDCPTPDGTPVRDYVHVTDLAKAHLLALQYLVNGGESTALNLGTGQGHSVREVIQTVERVSKKGIPCQEAPRRPGDPPILVADPRKANELLDWQPNLSDLDTIVNTAWRWHIAFREAAC